MGAFGHRTGYCISRTGMRSNRRRTARCECDLVVVWKRGGLNLRGHVRDVSADGLFVETNATIPLNHVMDVLVDLPSGPVSMLVVSRQCGRTARGQGIGASIFAIEPTERARWTAHYRSMLAAPRPRRATTERPTGA